VDQFASSVSGCRSPAGYGFDCVALAHPQIEKESIGKIGISSYCPRSLHLPAAWGLLLHSQAKAGGAIALPLPLRNGRV
jgi:hypothetical protein